MGSPQPRKPLTASQKRALRIAAVIAGIALGQLCPLLPVEKQFICHFAAKIVALFTGAA